MNLAILKTGKDIFIIINKLTLITMRNYKKMLNIPNILEKEFRQLLIANNAIININNTFHFKTRDDAETFIALLTLLRKE